MLINEVVFGVRRVLPGEYTTEEIYRWCDELSAELRLNYCKVYARCVISSVNGCFYLPEGITTEMVYSIIDNGREIPKCDLRTSGYYHIYTRDGNMLVKTEGDIPSEVVVNYIVPHEPIRIINETVTATGNGERDGLKYTSFSKKLDIETGDVLEVTSGETKTETGVLDVAFDENGNTIIGYMGDDLPEGNVNVIRAITEKTACDAPYDNMYVDFCTMKIAWYQRNYPVYGYMRSEFYEKLGGFSRYLRRNAGREEVTKIINYF